MNQLKQIFRLGPWAMGVVVMATLVGSAHAQSTGLPTSTTGLGTTQCATSTSTSTQVCTTFCPRGQALMNASTGAAAAPTTTSATGGDNTALLSQIYTFITTTVNSATQTLFNAFINNSNYQNAVYWAMVLMVLFYGIGFTTGLIQPSFQEALKRLLKMGFILTVISPNGGWTFFNEYIVEFFQNGSDDLIKSIQAIGFGYPVPAGATPFYALDQLAAFMVNPDTIIAIMGAVLGSGPYGMTMGGLLLIAFYEFFRLIITALQTYAICFVARALILGVAPIFIVFLLFEKTKNLFVSWLNMLLNLSLQPILLFTFLSFFIVMMQSAAVSMLGTELCWGQSTNVTGGQRSVAFWHFLDDNGNANASSSWNGSLQCLFSQGATGSSTPCKEFPINIVDLLSFLILVQLARRFTEVVIAMSQELSNTFVNLDSQSRFDLDKANNSAGAATSVLKPQQTSNATTQARTNPTGK